MRAFCALLCLASLTSACGDDDEFTTGDNSQNFDADLRADAFVEPLQDAAVDFDAAVPVISGSICILNDIRSPDGCLPLELANVAIHIDGIEDVGTLTNAAGEFVLPAQPLTGFPTVAIVATAPGVDYAVGAQLITLAADGSAATVKIKLVPRTRLATILAANGVTADPARGHFVATVRNAAGGQAIVSNATLGLIETVAPRYENGNPEQFVLTGTTGSLGFAAFFNVPPGRGTVDVKQGTAAARPRPYVVVQGALTFGTLLY